MGGKGGPGAGEAWVIELDALLQCLGRVQAASVAHAWAGGSLGGGWGGCLCLPGAQLPATVGSMMLLVLRVSGFLLPRPAVADIV